MKDIYLIIIFLIAVSILVAGAAVRYVNIASPAGDILTFSAFYIMGGNAMLLAWSHRRLIAKVAKR